MKQCDDSRSRPGQCYNIVMNMRTALKEQYHASLAMLAACVNRCPDAVWVSGTHPRAYWRIVFHAVFYAHLYLGQSVDVFVPWRDGLSKYASLWNPPGEVEPYELPETAAALTQRDALDYIAFVDSLVDPTLERLDLEAAETGFPWYPNMTKLSHEIMSLRHVQGHVGQLSELLMAHGIDTDWIAKAEPGACSNL